MKIKSKISETEEPKICAISNEAFVQKPGALEFFIEKDQDGTKMQVPVSPAAARRVGFDVSGVTPPGDLRSKSELSAWISSLGLKRSDEGYQQLYKNYSNLYEFIEVRGGKGYN
jgi:hypothetical protein